MGHFVTGITGMDGRADPPGNALTGTVIVGETSGVLLAVSSIVSVEPPDVCAILTLYVHDVKNVDIDNNDANSTNFFIFYAPVVKIA